MKNSLKIFISIAILWAVLMIGLFLIKRTIRDAFGHQELKMQVRQELESVLIHWEVGHYTLPRILLVKQETGEAKEKGKLVVGIGHDVTDADGLKLGEKISVKRMEKFFEHDLEVAELGATKLVTNLHRHPDNVQVVLAAMVFQLGYHGASSFKQMIKAVNRGDYELAAGEMLDSKWYKQTPRRCQSMAGLMGGY